MRRPPRISSLFAGFEEHTSDEVDEFAEDISDAEYHTPLSAPPMNSPRGGKPTTITSGPTSHPRSTVNHAAGITQTWASYNLASHKFQGSVGSPTRRSTERKRSALHSSNSMRRSVMLQNGISAHKRYGSPSRAAIRPPPFPIPTRASSRRPPLAAIAPGDDGSSPLRESWGRYGRPYRQISVRKPRSANVVVPGRNDKRTGGSRSPPPFSPRGVGREETRSCRRYRIMISQRRPDRRVTGLFLWAGTGRRCQGIL
jgi:hypothetical protein